MDDELEAVQPLAAGIGIAQGPSAQGGHRQPKIVSCLGETIGGLFAQIPIRERILVHPADRAEAGTC
jgi:hypothetical protein